MDLDIQKIEKSKITQIESLAKSIKLSFGKHDKDLDDALHRLVVLIEEEKESRNNLRDLVWFVANKL